MDRRSIFNTLFPVVMVIGLLSAVFFYIAKMEEGYVQANLEKITAQTNGRTIPSGPQEALSWVAVLKDIPSLSGVYLRDFGPTDPELYAIGDAYTRKWHWSIVSVTGKECRWREGEPWLVEIWLIVDGQKHPDFLIFEVDTTKTVGYKKYQKRAFVGDTELVINSYLTSSCDDAKTEVEVILRDKTKLSLAQELSTSEMEIITLDPFSYLSTPTSIPSPTAISIPVIQPASWEHFECNTDGYAPSAEKSLTNVSIEGDATHFFAHVNSQGYEFRIEIKSSDTLWHRTLAKDPSAHDENVTWSGNWQYLRGESLVVTLSNGDKVFLYLPLPGGTPLYPVAAVGTTLADGGCQ